MGAPQSLLRVEGDPWTVSDVPLLDELVDLLGRDKAAEAAAAGAERERNYEAEYAAGVLDLMVAREDLMDDEDHLIARDVIHAEALANRFVERDTRELAERAAADRDWTYRHVVVDEAQELSEMDWRVLMRRCPGRSFTVVGDLAQRRSPAGATSWQAMLQPYVAGRWEYRALTVNYRTPAEIMAVAAALLEEFAPGVQPPESVRACGVRPWSRRVSDDELAGAIEEFVDSEAGREGTSIVIGPPGVPGTVPASQTKGLEFDAVLVVDPQRILADGPRGAAELYVALTRHPAPRGAAPRTVATGTVRLGRIRDDRCGVDGPSERRRLRHGLRRWLTDGLGWRPTRVAILSSFRGDARGTVLRAGTQASGHHRGPGAAVVARRVGLGCRHPARRPTQAREEQRATRDGDICLPGRRCQDHCPVGQLLVAPTPERLDQMMSAAVALDV